MSILQVLQIVRATFPSLKRRGGRDIKQDVAKPPLKERTGWLDRRNLQA